MTPTMSQPPGADLGPYCVWYRCDGRPSGTHSGFKTQEAAEAAASDAVFGVWSSADAAKVSDGQDRIVATFAAELQAVTAPSAS